MFGDVMHGSLLLAFAIWLCLAKRTPTNIPGLVAPFRFFLLMMGFFSVYCGFIYNDYTSVGLYLFGPSCYTYTAGSIQPTLTADCVYPFGFDPSWYLSSYELNMFNSIKMKLAVILGVLQMVLGIVLKGTNYWYHRKPVDFCFEFIPQLVVMLAMFGFMDYLIIVKWTTDWVPAYAPSVVTTMIGMFLGLG
mmetsp:Transcript_20028/g.14517  ORF Transcript_20028/g.14517 Transcript_20028/m.14517 type:complete len:191 (+) Transcript_20028:1331-1903(+)